ncbi:protein-L-isoaspartate O-methyltransferase [candidate division WWE3 bacterium]|uniref:Protein-L-isoaspartate O-methyltransferase n=1 Tax=candidate division WWE3 bacterium TaxID=2053526 RepID=A0A955LKE4_UNCKA|nr:protein-L-isoaspartate O-methyltransferase [candidate division WWE3 bacterium]
MNSNADLIRHLMHVGVLQSPNVIDAFAKIDRKDFVTDQSEDEAYFDIALPIGFDQTISQPTTVAVMLELLDVQTGDSVLDVGSGSGWSTALLGHLVGDSGSVLGVEIIPELVSFGQQNLSKHHNLNATIGQAGEDLGEPGQTFDRILVSAEARQVPQALIDQLNVGGVMVIPINHSIFKISKVAENEIEKDEVAGFVFVPLVENRSTSID